MAQWYERGIAWRCDSAMQPHFIVLRIQWRRSRITTGVQIRMTTVRLSWTAFIACIQRRNRRGKSLHTVQEGRVYMYMCMCVYIYIPDTLVLLGMSWQLRHTTTRNNDVYRPRKSYHYRLPSISSRNNCSLRTRRTQQVREIDRKVGGGGRGKVLFEIYLNIKVF